MSRNATVLLLLKERKRRRATSLGRHYRLERRLLLYISLFRCPSAVQRVDRCWVIVTRGQLGRPLRGRDLPLRPSPLLPRSRRRVEHFMVRRRAVPHVHSLRSPRADRLRLHHRTRVLQVNQAGNSRRRPLPHLSSPLFLPMPLLWRKRRIC